MKKILSAVLFSFFVSLFAIPSFVSAQSALNTDTDEIVGQESSCVVINDNIRTSVRVRATKTKNIAEDVINLQEFFIANGYFSRSIMPQCRKVVDPIPHYGPCSVEAVINFKKDYNIYPLDGFVGKETRKKINEVSCSGTATPVVTPFTLPNQTQTTITQNTSSNQNLPAGCTSRFGFSTTVANTRCDSMITNDVCKIGDLFNKTNGSPCNLPAVAMQSIPVTVMHSPTTSNVVVPINILTGWNFIAFPPASAYVGTLSGFSSIGGYETYIINKLTSTDNTTTIYAFDNTDSKWYFYSPNQTVEAGTAYALSKGYKYMSVQTLRENITKFSFWVNSKKVYSLDFSFNPNAVPQNSLLRNGWNMISIGNTTPMSVSSFVAQSGKNITTIWAWVPGIQRWQFWGNPTVLQTKGMTLAQYAASKNYDVLTEIKPGVGYWVNVNGNIDTPANTAGESVSNIPSITITSPTISSINPSQGSANTTATIYGTNLSGVSSVQFYNSSGQNVAGMSSPSISSLNSTSLTFTISGVFAANVDAGTYQVGVVTNACADGCESNRVGFTLTAPTTTVAPNILSISPSTATPDQTITIIGSNLNLSANKVVASGNTYDASFVRIGTGVISSTQLSTTPRALGLTSAGVYPIKIGNSLTGDSNTVYLTVGMTTVSTPTIDSLVAPTSVTYGGSATVTWTTSSNTTSCTLNTGSVGDSISGGDPTSGSRVVSSITSPRTIDLSCRAGSGPLVSKSVLVNVTAPIVTTPAPLVTFTASQTSITSGQSATISWSSQMQSCTATGGWSGTLFGYGSRVVTPTQNTTYTLVCGNEPAQSVTVNVVTPVSTPVTISITPSWNLISFPPVSAYVSGATYDDFIAKLTDVNSTQTVYAYDNTDGKWFFYAPSESVAEGQAYATTKGFKYMDPATLRNNMGRLALWVNSHVAYSFTTSYNSTAPQNNNIQNGWNLSSIGNTSAMTVDAFVSQSGKNILTMWAFTPGTSRWQFWGNPTALQAKGMTLSQYTASKNYDVLTEIKPGVGYWVNVNGSIDTPSPAVGATVSLVPTNNTQLASLIGAFTKTSLPTPPSIAVPTSSKLEYEWDRNLEVNSPYADDVSALQMALTKEGVYAGEVTGGFYSQTYLGVKAFQAKYGIESTGFVGPTTRAKLNELY